MSKLKEVRNHFNNNWQNYKDFVANNRLCHSEMFSTLEQFLRENLEAKAFSFVDVGCGDCSLITPVLIDKAIKTYIGIDFADDVLKTAPNHLANLVCEKIFMQENMISAIHNIASPVDVIFASYSVHHLSYKEKILFIDACRNKLAPDGFFIMVDGILAENQSREEWLEAFENYYKAEYPCTSTEELNSRMKHPRTSDYPEAINTFASIAESFGWKKFSVLRKIDLLAFMVFSK